MNIRNKLLELKKWANKVDCFNCVTYRDLSGRIDKLISEENKERTLAELAFDKGFVLKEKIELELACVYVNYGEKPIVHKFDTEAQAKEYLRGQ